MEKPRLLIVLNRLSIGGPAANTLALAAILSKEFEILLLAGPPLSDEQSAAFLLNNYKGFRVEMVKGFKRAILPWYDLGALYHLSKKIKQFQPHIIHTHGSKPGVLVRLLFSGKKHPVLIHTYHGHVFHSYFNSWISNRIVQLERWLARRTKYLIAINEKLKHELVNVYHIAPAEKVILNRLGIEWNLLQDVDNRKRQQFRKEFQLQEHELAIAIIGRLVPVKNHSLFIEIASELINQSGQPLKFLIVGDGSEKEKILQQLQQKKIVVTQSGPGYDSTASFLFTSWRTDVDVVLAGIDLLVLTSLNEGTPVSIMEAMAAGKPVVSTDVGGVHELFAETGTGFTGTGKTELVQQLLQLIRQPELRRAMGMRASEYSQMNLSIEYQAKNLAVIYKEALSNG